VSTQVTLDAQALATWLGLIVASVGAVVAVGRWIIRSLDRRVRELTRSIQPEANGGGSLPDVARSVKALAESNDRAHGRLHDRIDGLSGDVRELQLWAADRPCLLDREDLASRARRRLHAAQDPPPPADPECPAT